jgi:hypothetical protein
LARTSVNFGKGELEVARAAADAAGLCLNAWIRRACEKAVEMERSLALEAERSLAVWTEAGTSLGKVRVERPGPGLPVPVRPFVPDFKGGK